MVAYTCTKVAFQTADYMLITMSLMILAGNTCYPIFLRLIIWTMFKLLPDYGERCGDWKVTLRFLLDHPRRCYTNLFPARHTWWLLATLICLNGTDWAAFEVLNIGNSTVASLPRGARALDGLFQAFCRPQRRFLRCPHRRPPDRAFNPLRNHDVHLRLPRRNNHAQLQRLRRTQPRYLRR